MTPQERIDNYVRTTKLPQSIFAMDNGCIVGTFVMGNDYRVKSKYYGGYPAGYLKRMRALFPEKQRCLHLFSGKVDTEAFPGTTVDINPDNNPDILDDAHSLSRVPLHAFDLVMADPPYSVEDALHYGACMVNRNKVVRALERLPCGAHVIWLDQVKPMWRKEIFKPVMEIGMSKSSNHRYRIILVYERLPRKIDI